MSEWCKICMITHFAHVHITRFNYGYLLQHCPHRETVQAFMDVLPLTFLHDIQETESPENGAKWSLCIHRKSRKAEHVPVSLP